MGYKLGNKYPPETPNIDDDLWSQEIDFDEGSHGDLGWLSKHDACIEVHADSEELLDARVDAILFGLGLLTPDWKK
jgi:hypothetical protein